MKNDVVEVLLGVVVFAISCVAINYAMLRVWEIFQ